MAYFIRDAILDLKPAPYCASLSLFSCKANARLLTLALPFLSLQTIYMAWYQYHLSLRDTCLYIGFIISSVPLDPIDGFPFFLSLSTHAQKYCVGRNVLRKEAAIWLDSTWRVRARFFHTSRDREREKSDGIDLLLLCDMYQYLPRRRRRGLFCQGFSLSTWDYRLRQVFWFMFWKYRKS